MSSQHNYAVHLIDTKKLRFVSTQGCNKTSSRNGILLAYLQGNLLPCNKNRIHSVVYAVKTIKSYYEDLLEILFEAANEKSNLNISRLNQLGIESHEVSTSYKDRDFNMTKDLFQDQIAIEVVNISAGDSLRGMMWLLVSQIEVKALG